MDIHLKVGISHVEVVIFSMVGLFKWYYKVLMVVISF